MSIREVVVAPGQTGRVDRIVATLTGRSRALVRGLIQHGCVQINHLPCRSDFDRVAPGDVVTVTYNEERKYREASKAQLAPPFHIFFEDEHLLVVEKPAPWLTVPTPKGETDTLVNHLQTYLRRDRRNRTHIEVVQPLSSYSSDRRGSTRPLAYVGVVQRLDRGVSGVLVFGKTPAVGKALANQFASAKPEREYIALVAGRMEAEQGRFDQWLITDKTSLQRRVAPRPGIGESAITHYKVIARRPGVTRVRVRLETGRRNQIRVHFAHAGHPVLGDPRYGGELSFHPRWPHRRMALHAAVLGFTHPVTGQSLRFESPVPTEFDGVC